MTIIKRIGAYIPRTYTSIYPPSHNDTYVKVTTKASTDFWPYYATNPAKSVINGDELNAWASATGSPTNNRFHIDLGSSYDIRRIYYENGHDTGTGTTTGAKDVIIQGSNDATAFSTLTYTTDTNWTQIGSGQFVQHVAANQADPQYLSISYHVPYRYYAIKISNNWGSSSWTELRRIVLQTLS